MKILLEAKTAEEIFGKIKNSEELKAEFRKLAKLLHPDVNKTPEATLAFEKLNQFHVFAQKLIKDGDYGKNILFSSGKEIISFGKNVIDNIAPFKTGKICDLKTGILNGAKVLIKISKNTADNDLLAQESAAYAKIDEFVKGKPLQRIRDNHINKLLHSFIFQGRRVNVFAFIDNVVTLEEVAGRVDARSAVWIWKRMAAALDICHQAGVIHNAVLPDNFLLDLDNHNGILIDFCYSTSGKPKLIDSSCKSFYPHEVFDKEILKPETDIYLMAQTIKKCSKDLPKRFDSLIKACILKYGRLDSAREIYNDVNSAALACFGEPKFHPFPLQ